MEEFESLGSIIEHFKIKQLSLDLFGINFASHRHIQQVRVTSNERMYSHMPRINDSSGDSHTYKSAPTTLILSDNSNSQSHSVFDSDAPSFKDTFNSTMQTFYLEENEEVTRSKNIGRVLRSELSQLTSENENVIESYDSQCIVTSSTQDDLNSEPFSILDEEEDAA